MLALSPIFGADARAADSGVESVLASAARALGAQHLVGLASMHATSSGTLYGLTAKSESYTNLAASGANATYTQVGPYSVSSGYDGRDAWTRDPSGVVWVDGSQQGHATAVNEAFRESYALWTPSHGGAATALLPQTSANGRSYDVVAVTAPGSVVPFSVWIDRATHLPARYVETAAAVTTTTLLGDYRAVAGVKIPFDTRQATDQGNETRTTIARVDAAPADVAAKIRKPATDVHDYSIAGGDTTTVPFDLIDNHVYLNVLLDGKGPFRFIFDTGGANIIDPAVARMLGAGAVGTMQGGGVGATTEQMSFASGLSLRVGNAELHDQLFIVAPVRAGFGTGGSAPVDGIIGAEVLARFTTVFDYARSRVTFRRSESSSAAASIPFVFNGTQPEVACEIAQVATRCTIDTGSRSSLDVCAPFIAANPAVVPPNVTAPGVNGFGVGGADVGRLGRLKSLKLGGFALDDLVAGLSSATTGAFANPGVGANIGGAVLKRFTVTFDYGHQTLSLVPNAKVAERDAYERSGLFVVNAGKLMVAGVRPGTPGAAVGFVKGDTIVSLDGVSVPRLTLGTVREAFRHPAGTELRIGVLGAGAAEPRIVTLTLADYV